MSDITLPTGQRSILMTPVDINGTVISGAPPTILGTFRAINNGTGYSINDIIVLRQVGSNPPEYYNATTNAVIATPLAADLGNVSATNVTVSSALPSGSNTIGSIANTTFAATQSGTWNLTNISGTVSLPTGAATSANQIPAFTVSAKTLGTANAATVKASSGKVYSLSVTNLNASVRYLQIVNKATTPTNSDSASIVDVWTIPANGTVIIDSPYYGANGLSCSTGISWAFSSTATTITLATAGDCLVSVGYV